MSHSPRITVTTPSPPLPITAMDVVQPVEIGLTPSQKRNLRRKRIRYASACHNHRHGVFHMLRDLAMQRPDEHRTPTHYDAWGGGEWTVSEQWECKCHDTVHSSSVTYVRNPRDVDLVSSSFDGEDMGYTMF